TYDTVVGQFGSVDPIGLAGGDSNTRRYVGNSVADESDPSGLSKSFYDLKTWEDYLEWSREQVNERLQDAKDDPFYEPNPSKPRPGEIDRNAARRSLERMKNYLEQRQLQRTVAQKAAERVQLLGRLGLIGALTVIGSVAYYHVGMDLGELFPIQPDPFPFKVKEGRVIPILGTGDPNNLVGPAGFGSQNWVAADSQSLPYTIQFENDPKLATAAAQDVVVTEQLDGDLDWSTFQLGLIQFGATKVDVPDGLQSFSTRVD